MSKKFDFDYLVIGSGPAGSTAALILATNKKSHVAIAEGSIFGGSNLATRDIPYLVGQKFAHIFHEIKQAPEIGTQNLHFNFPTTVSHQTAVAKLLGAGSTQIFENAKITCLKGFAHFLDDHTVAIGDKKFTSNVFVLATGTSLFTGDIIGLDTVGYLTPSSALRLRRLPKAITIVGGGPTGCEIAEYYAKLGSKVVLLEKASHLLPNEDKEAGLMLRDYFTHELGITVGTSAKVVAIESDSIAKRTIFKLKDQDKMVRSDCIVLATGSKPNTDCGLENASIRLKPTGEILVNKLFQTTAKNIFAIGDCIGGNSSSTERAEYEASILADNLINKSKNIVDHKGFIRVVNTNPEIASVGRTEAQLDKRHVKYNKSIVLIKDLPASVIDGLDYGFVKLIISRRTNHLLGATIMAPGASYLAEELALALRHHLTVRELASTPHIANNYSYAVKLSAKKLIV